VSTKTEKPLDFAFDTFVHLCVIQTKRRLRRSTSFVRIARALSVNY
jgi:hypothetical protein